MKCPLWYMNRWNVPCINLMGRKIIKIKSKPAAKEPG
jgi:hypothetical protein